MNKEFLVSRLTTYQAKSLPQTAVESAVLLLVVYDENGDLSVVITKRSENITYPGDYCFPGGVKDIFDRDFDLAVMRELREELSIGEEYYQMIAQLDDFHDRYGNRVRPFIAIISKNDFEDNFQISSDEISDLHLLPLSELSAIAESEELTKLTRRSPSYLYSKNDVRVWGLTASILVHFSNIIFNGNKLVGNEILK